MEQYINKAALLTEIERFRKSNKQEEDKDYAQFEFDVSCGYDMALDDVEKFINTLEVKEVDLEKALSDLDKDIKEFVITEEFERESETCGHYWTIAKHAFLLGIKAQKGD